MAKLHICGLVITAITIPIIQIVEQNNYIKKTRPHMTRKDRTIYLAGEGFSVMPVGIAFGIIWPLSVPILILSGVLAQDDKK